MKRLFLALGFLFAFAVPAFAGPLIYMDTGGCNSASTTQCSGTTDSATATVSGTSATITCSATTFTGSTPGCSLSGSPSLSGIATDGTQAIFVNCATNSNQKIFFINGIDDGSDLVGTTATPTGCTASTSDWGIGGRMIYAQSNFRGALHGGEQVIINNTPAAIAGSFYVPASSEEGSSTTGFIKFTGKVGVRPVLNTTNTSNVIQIQNNVDYIYFDNLELDQDGASGTVFNLANNTNVQIFANNIKITDGGGIGVSSGPSGSRLTFQNGEVTGVGGDCISINTTGIDSINNYLHDCAGDGIENASTGLGIWRVLGNIIESNTGRGLYQSAATSAGIIHLMNNTIALNGNSGLETTDTDIGVNMINEIYYNNGDAAGEYNVELAVAAELIGWHSYNDFYQGSGSAGNLSNLTTNSTEITTDPLFTNAAGGDFSLTSSSPALNTGYPGTFVGGSVGYISMGAVQSQAGGGSSGGFIIGGN